VIVQCQTFSTIWKIRAVDKTVARLNVEHCRKLLAPEIDHIQRQTLRRLLVEEEAKLVALADAPDPGKPKH
jgi:hypothetical protein